MKLEYLVIHCTATPEGREVTKEEILHWHTSPKSEGGRGWRRAGYTDLIHLDGSISNITPFDQDDDVEGFEITNGARGLNSISRHIVYAGGVDRFRQPLDTRTEAQEGTLEAYVVLMVARYPDIKIIGHNQVSTKACPSFNVPEWLEEIGTPRKNIVFNF